MKTIYCTCICLLTMVSAAFALDYTDVYGDIADFFSTFAGDDEGVTGFRSLNIPIGGRAEALGTAFVGAANDITYLEYNPAASAVLPYTEFAVFHNSWIADSALETIAWTMRKNHFGGGGAVKCFYVPFTEYDLFGERVTSGYYSETVVLANLSYNFLAGYTFKGIAAGINLKAAYRSVPDYGEEGAEPATLHSGLSQSAVGAMADVGALLQFNFLKLYASRDPNLRIGVSLHNLGVAFTNLDGTPALDDPLPTRISAGFSYRLVRPVMLTAEFRQPFNLQEFALLNAWSAAAGIDIGMTEFFALQAGFLLQGGNPRLSLGGEVTVRGIQINANYTLDMTSSLTPFNRVSVSAKLLLGDRGRSVIADQVDDYYQLGLNEYAQEHYDEAISFWKEGLRLNPGFDPASDGIFAAERAKNLQIRINDLPSLDDAY